MKKYSVLVEETLSRNVIVEARDEEHADEIVQKAYDEQRIVLTADDFNGELVLGGEYTEKAKGDCKVTDLKDSRVELKEKIVKSIEGYKEMTGESINFCDREDIVKIFALGISQDLMLEMSLELRSDSFDSDYWLQVEYYSKKLEKTIIFDYDYEDNYTDVNSFAEAIVDTELKITAFENKLTKIKI